MEIPVKKNLNVPQSFALPMIKREPIIKFSTQDKNVSTNPALDETVYIDILKICHELGTEIERHPSIYFSKHEEDLRNLFLMFLSPHFKSVSGKTFDTSGNSDIVIPYQNSNVFVAECEVWKGIKAFYKAIEQVLSNCTWHDTKTAILCFIQNKYLLPVLDQIENKTSKHSCFVKSRGKLFNSWFNFEFHLPHDTSRRVVLAVLCFYLPEITK
jgi:hypothetical protein